MIKVTQFRDWIKQLQADIKEKNIQQVWFLYRSYLLGIFVVVLTLLGIAGFGVSQIMTGKQADPNHLVLASEEGVEPDNLTPDQSQKMEETVESKFSASKVDATSSEIDKNVARDRSSTTETWYVDIKGAVKVPQVVPVEPGMRVHDAIEMVGGVTEEADHGQVNLAQLLSDQMVIYVPKKGETVDSATEALVVDSQVLEIGDKSELETENDLVNINTADVIQLQTLSGIGEKRATDIMNYREANGPFKTIDDLDQVSGIGEKTMEKLRPLITVN